MKLAVVALAGAMLLLDSQARADMLGLTLTADVAKLGLSGRAGDHGFSQPLQFSDDSWQSGSISFEHPLPLIPNIAVRRQSATWAGRTELSALLQLDQIGYGRQSTIRNSLDLQSTEVNLYYELLDHSLLSFDAGISALVYDIALAVAEPEKRRGASGILPLVSAHLTVPLWGIDSAVFWQGNYSNYRDQRWTESKIGFSYQMVDLKFFSAAVKLGWQEQSVALINRDRLDLDFQMTGPFLALEADF